MSIKVNGTELTEVIYQGVNVDTVKVIKGTADPVTVFEKAHPSAGETWVLNEKIEGDGSIQKDVTYSIDFVSNATNFSEIKRGTGEDPFFPPLYYGSIKVYSYEPGWINQAYRTITFATPPTGDLLTWLQANGVKQGPSKTVKVEVAETNEHKRKEFTVRDGDENGTILYSNTSQSGRVPSPQTFEITSGYITFVFRSSVTDGIYVQASNITGLERVTGTNTFKVISNGSIKFYIDYYI